MKTRPVLFLMILIFYSCAVDTLREDVNAYVFYKNSPVKNAEILTCQGYEKGFVKETVTDSSGFFHLKKNTRYVLGLESRDLSQKFLIKKDKIISDTLSTPSSKITFQFKDTIYLHTD